MVVINCAAIPESLIENELFGHEKGAFTGADSRRPGKFELAHGGSIFLDEIGELPLGVQGKLLRVLEERVVERLGGTVPFRADVRVIAATNRDLQGAVNAGEFRSDLFYRLNVLPIHIPPLRERAEDVVLIAEAFLNRFRRERNKPQLKFAAAAVAAICNHSWPGNVRELQNAIERASILCEGEITPPDLGLGAAAKAAAAAANADPGYSLEGTLPEVSARAVEAVERAKIDSALRECKWNKQTAAERLGVSYKTLLNKLKQYGLD
jgi:transcriptional regulator with GAF, ATPase, and Fis domain